VRVLMRGGVARLALAAASFVAALPATAAAQRALAGVAVGAPEGADVRVLAAPQTRWRRGGLLALSLAGLPARGALGAALGATLGLATGNRWTPVSRPMPNAGGR
jgi:hypothetical protein